MSRKQSKDDYMIGLGANERALLEKIPLPFLRKTAASLVRQKMKLQFTGWLQYLIPLPLIVLLGLISALTGILGFSNAAYVFLLLGSLLFLRVIYDIVTVKFKLHFPEKLPERKSGMDYFSLMRSRESCRSFQNRRLRDEDRRELRESIFKHGGESLIGERPIRLEFISEALTVWPVVNGTEFIVAVAPADYDPLAVVDVGRTLQKVVMDATALGIASCWIGPGADQSSIIKHLGERFDPGRDHIICVCAVGYKSRYAPLFIRIFNRQMKRRRSLDRLFFKDDNFKEAVDTDCHPYNKYGRNYEICQWAPSSYNGQTTRAVVTGNGEMRIDFYCSTASRYYAPVALGIWCANWEEGCRVLGREGGFHVLEDVKRTEGKGADPPWYYVSWVESI